MKAVPLAQAPKQDLLDRAAILLSGLCLVHCTLLPVALAVLQAYGTSLVPSSLDNGWFHGVMAVSLVAVGGFAFRSGYVRHRRLFPPVAGTIGTALLLAGAFAGMGETAEHGLTILGTLILLVAHARNRRPLAAHHHHDSSCKGKH